VSFCRLVAVKGFIQLILRQLQSGPAPPLLPDSSASFSQASSSQVGLIADTTRVLYP
jgi:uncharacterized membrane protein